MSLLTPDFGLLFWMFLSFSIVFLLLVKFGFPVITKMVDERREYIRESLSAADEANRKLLVVKHESETMLKATRIRQNELMRQAVLESEKIVQEAKEQAVIEAQKQIDDAYRQIDVQKQKVMSDIREQVAQLSVAIAEKILRIQLEHPESQNAMIDRLLDEVEKN